MKSSYNTDTEQFILEWGNGTKVFINSTSLKLVDFNDHLDMDEVNDIVYFIKHEAIRLI